MSRLIIPLGNNGFEFNGTRHNAGLYPVLQFGFVHSDIGVPCFAGPHKQQVYFQANLDKKELACWFPLALSKMNESGKAIKEIMDELGFKSDELILVHDELEMPLGSVGWDASGVTNGHHGVMSVFEELGTSDILRLKVGIDSEETHSLKSKTDIVLGKFQTPELSQLGVASGKGATLLNKELGL